MQGEVPLLFGWVKVGVFTILLSLILSFGVVLVFRYLDKDNNSMDKVRQYADKRMSDFDAYFKDKNHALMTVGAELDAKQTMSAAAVKRFEKQLAEFRQMTENLSEKTSVVDNLKQKTSEYEDELAKLVDMSARVEENLLRIQKASSVIDQVNARFDAQKKTADSIEKKLSVITADFAGKNAEQLKAIGSELLNRYQLRAQKLDESTGAAQKRSEELLAKLNADIASAYNSAAQKATQLEDTVFKHLSEKASARCESYKTEINRNSEEIKKQLSDTADFLTKAMAETEQREKSLQERYESLLEEQNLAFDKQLERKFAELNSRIDESADRIRQTTQELAEEADGNGKTLEGIRASLESQIAQLQERYNSMFLEAVSDAENREKAAYEKYREISERNLESYKNSVQEKINLINESAVSAAKSAEEKLSAVTASLSNLDARIEEYKKDLLYRLSNLEMSGQDLESLESAVRKAMDQTQNRILSDFTDFSAAQQKRQSDFELSIKDNSDRIAAELSALEKSLDALKESAVNSVSEKLHGLEDSFDSNLRVSATKLSDELNEWKQDFDSRLGKLSGQYEDQRHAVESNYTEDLKNKLLALQERNKEFLTRSSSDITLAREDIQEQLEQVRSEMTGFMEQYRVNLQQASSDSEKALKEASEAYNARIISQLEKKEKEILEDLKAFEEGVESRQKTGVSSIDAAMSEFNTWKQHLRQQFDEARSLFEEQLLGMKDAAAQKIEEAQGVLDGSMEEYSSERQKKLDELSERIESLDDKTETSISEYEDRSKNIVSEMQKMYEEMLKTTEERVRSQTTDSEQKIRALRTEIQSAGEENRVRQANMVMKMQNDANDFQTRMSELDKELKSIEVQMQLYEKAEQMKKQLDDRLTELDNRFNKIDLYRSDAEKLTAEYNSLLKLDNEINEKLLRFNSGRSQIENIESKFDKLLALSGNMDTKIKDLQTASDDLQEIQISVRNFQNTLSGISDRYDRLEKKNEVIDRVASDVDKTFENLRELEQRLSNCNRQASSLPAEIEDVQKNVDLILSSNGRINEAVEKLDSLREILEEADRKTDAIKSERDGIGRSEARLHQLSQDIDTKFNLLARLTKADLEKNPGKQSPGITPQDREAIKTLKRQGWKISEIARRMNHSETEIELILDMPDD